MKFKDYIAKQLIGKKLRFKCNCIVPLNIIGMIKDYSIKNNEIIFDVEIKQNKFIKIGENHPNLEIEIL